MTFSQNNFNNLYLLQFYSGHAFKEFGHFGNFLCKLTSFHLIQFFLYQSFSVSIYLVHQFIQCNNLFSVAINCVHTTQNDQNKWTKILTLEMTMFGLKMMVKSGLYFFYFEVLRAPSELLLPRMAELAWHRKYF